MSLAAARVLVVGAGGLGCPATLALAREGIRRLTVVDPDVVETSNLPRQLWHRLEEVGRPKVESLGRRLRAAFPDVQLALRQERVDAAGAADLFTAHDLVLDGTDGVETKFLLSDTAVRTGVPLIHGGALRWEGLALAIVPGGPCLRCLFEVPPDPRDAPSCASAGVIGALVGWVGAQQAAMALEVLGAPTIVGGRAGLAPLHRFDARALRWRTIDLARREDCGCAHGFNGEAA